MKSGQTLPFPLRGRIRLRMSKQVPRFELAQDVLRNDLVSQGRIVAPTASGELTHAVAGIIWLDRKSVV